MICEIKKILYATDLAPETAMACGLMLRLASALGAQVHVLHCVEPSFVGAAPTFSLADGEEVTSDASQVIRERLNKLRAQWTERRAGGLRVVSIHVFAGLARDTIIAKAESISAHMIVLGTHKQGVLGRLLRGSVAQTVVTTSPIPVLIVPLRDSSGICSAASEAGLPTLPAHTVDNGKA